MKHRGSPARTVKIVERASKIVHGPFSEGSEEYKQVMKDLRHPPMVAGDTRRLPSIAYSVVECARPRRRDQRRQTISATTATA